MIDFKLDENNDLDFTDNGLSLINGLDWTIQKVKFRLRFFEGDWYLDITLGVPYFQKILIKNPNRLDVINAIKRAIIQTPTIKSIDYFKITEESAATRTLKIDFDATADEGQLTISEVI